MKFTITPRAQSPLQGNSDFTNKIEANDLILPSNLPKQTLFSYSFVSGRVFRGLNRRGRGQNRTKEVL